MVAGMGMRGDVRARAILAALHDGTTPPEDRRELALAYVLWVDYGVRYEDVARTVRSIHEEFSGCMTLSHASRGKESVFDDLTWREIKTLRVMYNDMPARDALGRLGLLNGSTDEEIRLMVRAFYNLMRNLGIAKAGRDGKDGGQAG